MALMVPIRKMAKNLALALRVEDYDEEEYVEVDSIANNTVATINTNDNDTI